MRVVLKPKIYLCEGYRDMRPRGSEAFAFAHMRHSSKVFFVLLLRLMLWFVGSSGDDVDDVDLAAGGCVACSFRYLSWFKLCWWG